MWKKLPYWLKGGIIGGVIALIFFSLSPLCYQFRGDAVYGCTILGIPNFPVAFFVSIYFRAPIENPTSWLVYIIGGVITYFIIGAIIGKVIEKRKRKELPRNSSEQL